jgi:hypothetical protein
MGWYEGRSSLAGSSLAGSSLTGSASSMVKLTISNVSRRGDREARSAQDERTVMVCTPKVSTSVCYSSKADSQLRNYRRRSIRGSPMVVSKRQGQGPIVYFTSSTIIRFDWFYILRLVYYSIPFMLIIWSLPSPCCLF